MAIYKKTNGSLVIATVQPPNTVLVTWNDAASLETLATDYRELDSSDPILFHPAKYYGDASEQTLLSNLSFSLNPPTATIADTLVTANDFSAVSGYFDVFVDNVLLTPSADLSFSVITEPDVDASIDASTGQFTFTNKTPAAAFDTTYVEFQAIYKGISKNLIFTLTKVAQGQDGSRGARWIYATDTVDNPANYDGYYATQTPPVSLPKIAGDTLELTVTGSTVTGLDTGVFLRYEATDQTINSATTAIATLTSTAPPTRTSGAIEGSYKSLFNNSYLKFTGFNSADVPFATADFVFSTVFSYATASASGRIFQTIDAAAYTAINIYLQTAQMFFRYTQTGSSWNVASASFAVGDLNSGVNIDYQVAVIRRGLSLEFLIKRVDTLAVKFRQIDTLVEIGGKVELYFPAGHAPIIGGQSDGTNRLSNTYLDSTYLEFRTLPNGEDPPIIPSTTTASQLKRYQWNGSDWVVVNYTGATGATGADGTNYRLDRNKGAVNKTSATVFTPTSVTYTARKTTGATDPVVDTTAVLKIAFSNDGVTYGTEYASGGITGWNVTNGVGTLTPSNNNINTYKYFKILYYTATGTLVDHEDIEVTYGLKGIGASFVNGAMNFAADSAGDIAIYASNTATASVSIGSANLTYHASNAFTYSVTAISITAINANGTTTNGSFTVSAGSQTSAGITAAIGLTTDFTIQITAVGSNSGSKVESATISCVLSVRDEMSIATSKTITLTVGKLKAGMNGADGSTVLMELDNDYQGISCDSSGDAGSFSAVSNATIKINGIENLTGWTFNTPTYTGCSGTTTNTNKTATVTAITANNASVVFSATHATYGTITKPFNLSKVIGGAAGVVYRLARNTGAIIKHSDGTFTPTNLTGSAFTNTSTYTGRFKVWVSTDNGASYPTWVYESSTDETSFSWAVTGAFTDIKIELYKGGETVPFTTLLDYAYVGLTNDGINGSQSHTITLYQRKATTPVVLPANDDFTYNFSTKAITEVNPTDWETTIPSGSYPLYAITAIATVAPPATTYSFQAADWTSAKLFAQDGAISVIAYKVLTKDTLPTAPAIGAGHVPTPGAAVAVAWDATSSTTDWYDQPKATSLAANEYMFQINGTKDATGAYTWSPPSYLSTFKVGELSALTVNTGYLDVTKTLNVTDGGFFRSVMYGMPTTSNYTTDQATGASITAQPAGNGWWFANPVSANPTFALGKFDSLDTSLWHGISWNRGQNSTYEIWGDIVSSSNFKAGTIEDYRPATAGTTTINSGLVTLTKVAEIGAFDTIFQSGDTVLVTVTFVLEFETDAIKRLRINDDLADLGNFTGTYLFDQSTRTIGSRLVSATHTLERVLDGTTGFNVHIWAAHEVGSPRDCYGGFLSVSIRKK